MCLEYRKKRKKEKEGHKELILIFGPGKAGELEIGDVC